MEKLKDEGPTALEITNIKATLLRSYESQQPAERVCHEPAGRALPV
jgi:hypothetical protein